MSTSQATSTPPTPSMAPVGRPYNLRARVINHVMKILCTGCAAVAILCLVSIVSYVAYRGVTSLNWSLFTRDPGPLKPETAVASTNRNLTLVRGEAYRGDQAMVFIDTDREWPALSAGTPVELQLTPRRDRVLGPELRLPGRLTSKSPDPAFPDIRCPAVAVEATSAQTRTLAYGSLAYDFTLAARQEGKPPVVLAEGRASTQEPTGLRNGIQGTLVLILLSALIGVPMGIACGTYLAEYGRGNTFAHTVRLIVDILVGVPSILVGVLAFELVVQPPGWLTAAVNRLLHILNGQWHWSPGNSAWAGACALAFIMIPIVARTTEEMLQLVPQAYREASTGVGASKAQTIFRVVLPAAKGGIITGVMLAVARVAGETAPLIFTVVGSNQPVFNLTGPSPLVDLNNPFPALTLQIYDKAGSGQEEWIRQAWAGMLVLVFLIMLLNLAVRWVSRSRDLAKR